MPKKQPSGSSLSSSAAAAGDSLAQTATLRAASERAEGIQSALDAHLRRGRGSRWMALRHKDPAACWSLIFCAMASFFAASIFFSWGDASPGGGWQPGGPLSLASTAGLLMAFSVGGVAWAWRAMGKFCEDELARARRNAIGLASGPGKGLSFRGYEERLIAELSAAQEALSIAEFCEFSPSASEAKAPAPSVSSRRTARRI